VSEPQEPVERTVVAVRADALEAVRAAIEQEKANGTAHVALAFLRLLGEHPHVLDVAEAEPELPPRSLEVDELVHQVGHPRQARTRARVYGRP
jgi:hypothetical protein